MHLRFMHTDSKLFGKFCFQKTNNFQHWWECPHVMVWSANSSRRLKWKMRSQWIIQCHLWCLITKAQLFGATLMDSGMKIPRGEWWGHSDSSQPDFHLGRQVIAVNYLAGQKTRDTAISRSCSALMSFQDEQHDMKCCDFMASVSFVDAHSLQLWDTPLDPTQWDISSTHLLCFVYYFLVFGVLFRISFNFFSFFF